MDVGVGWGWKVIEFWVGYLKGWVYLLGNLIVFGECVNYRFKGILIWLI